MFDSSKFLLILGQDPVKWAARHGVEPVTYPCDKCGIDKTTTIPFASGQFRGLISPKCVCGSPDRAPYCFVRDAKYGDLFDAN